MHTLSKILLDERADSVLVHSNSVRSSICVTSYGVGKICFKSTERLSIGHRSAMEARLSEVMQILHRSRSLRTAHLNKQKRQIESLIQL